jgi:hypothetical protein
MKLSIFLVLLITSVMGTAMGLAPLAQALRAMATRKR